MPEFKNRFRMFKSPSSDVLFESTFSGLHITGISFEGETFSQPTQRTFCTCGFNDKEIHSTCPKCHGQILSLSRSWGGSSHKSIFYDTIELPSGEFSVSRVQIVIDAPQGVKYFNIGSERNEVGRISQTPDGPMFELAPAVSASAVPTPKSGFSSSDRSYAFTRGAVDSILKMYADAGIVLGDIKRLLDSFNSASASCAAINAMYYLPLAFNDENYKTMPHTLETLLRTDWIANMCNSVPKCPFYNNHRYHWKCGGGKPDRTFTMDDVLWISGIIPEIGCIEKFLSNTWSVGATWATEGDDLVASRDFIRNTEIGRYIVHRYQTGNMSRSDFEEWLNEAPNTIFGMKKDKLDLFFSWYKERVDITTKRFTVALPIFNKNIELLQSLGYFPDEDLLRQRRFNTIANQMKYQLDEYIDIDAGMKNPTQLIINMGKLVAASEE